MIDLKAFNDKRAEIYWWIASIFIKELSEAELEQYRSSEIKTFIESLGDVPVLTEPSDDLLKCINKICHMDDPQLQLSSDFSDLFLSSDKRSISACASSYQNMANPAHKVSAQEIINIMQSHNITLDQIHNEPADHISNILDFLGNLIIRSNELEQRPHLESALKEQETFIRSYLLSWMYDFKEQINAKDQFGFYAAFTRLLVSFLELDCEYLASPDTANRNS
ncbi:molecular chaperone TorD [Vibrio marisflavi]|uniref:Chaperone protein TorD n=1 Tax=Vibrio marisflavi CECT 7928 TaxID=634439 RepID=A0ABN8E4X7_9VIBR|nr:molecular chaperone TorD [Vibrio marisflavi]CAH0540544.1 Chaperone protein TorD [Vibrio marisflavi CECT 7928]